MQREAPSSQAASSSSVAAATDNRSELPHPHPTWSSASTNGTRNVPSAFQLAAPHTCRSQQREQSRSQLLAAFATS